MAKLKKEQKHASLKKVSIFSSLDNAHLEKIASIAIEKNYKKHEVIFHQGDPGSVLLVLASGAVKISMIDANNKEFILKVIHENDFFGEMSLLDGHFRSATVTAVSECKTLIIYRNDFVDMIKTNPSVVLEMVAVLSRRLRKADEHIASLSFFDAYGKVARLLLDLASTSEKQPDGKIVLDLIYSRQELASMAGLTRETFTRILTEFEVRECIEIHRKKITILDEMILQREIL